MARQERAIRTRQAILEAAAALFDEFGYEGASTTDIIMRSGLTRGALYHHFPSKESIAVALVDAQSQALEAPERDLRLQSLIDLTFEYARKLQTDLVLRVGVRLTVEQTSIRSHGGRPYRAAEEAVHHQLQLAAQNGELLPGLNLQEVTDFIVGAFTGVQLVSHVYSERQDLLERVSAMWRLVLPGLAVTGLLVRLRVTPP
ncbi:ScbR family autoregulator-binding transcription factor [Streptomyces sp. NPDC014889]|uniref:ScbR family autoregulator-binding transcription factor n=1 Tax=Streptomyces sp. NPDC014889 TaxID=3364928 RepID=UPI0036F61E10